MQSDSLQLYIVILTLLSGIQIAVAKSSQKKTPKEPYEGRIGGAGPSADYLRENTHRLRHSSTGIPDRAYGSSSYTPQTYRRGVYNGSVYWTGHMYGWRFPDGAKMPTICTNTAKTRPNRSTLGPFICPMSKGRQEYFFCCGEVSQEFCCDELAMKVFYYTARTTEDDLRDFAYVMAIMGGIFLPFVVILVIIALCRLRSNCDITS